MFKLLSFVITSFLLLTPYAFAQNIFDQPPPKSSTPGSTPTGSMNANDFKNAVNQMSQQTNNSLNQQAKQLYPKPQPGAKGTTAAVPPGNQPTATPSTVDNPFSVNGNAPAKAQPGTNAPSQPDGYSGFGSGSKSNKSNPPASSGNSGGWNINY